MIKKKKYNSKDYSTREWIEEMILKGKKGGYLKQIFSGIDSNYRIQERDTYDKTLTDTYYLIVSGLYPVYLKYGYDLDKLTRKVLEEMIDGGNPQEYNQVYQYIWNELRLREKYTDLPFIVVDKDLIYKMKKSDNYWDSLDKNDAFADPEAFFCEEYNNGGRQGYVYIKQQEDEYIQRCIKNSIEKGKFKDILCGDKEEYRIITPQSQCQDVTDIYRVLRRGLYPLYLEGFKEIKDITRKTIEEMIEECNPIALSQVYEYVYNESRIIENYCNYPFSILDKELINRIRNTKSVMEKMLKSTVVDNMTVWEGIEYYENKLAIFTNTEEFFREYAG